ncbi:hypothetical protein JOD64_001194 [Micromonospora luteifusca]|uniref:Uncharacterized protein n=1 Tax=Micromonospora luteifusca TaxID=709860 RepID=A0ABS2LPC0_9ACTN|nr:hypothetical protein [Micromonospora luteifusca]
MGGAAGAAPGSRVGVSNRAVTPVPSDWAGWVVTDTDARLEDP